MAYGDYEGDTDLREAWYAFCEQLKRAGDRVFKDVNPPTALQRSDGFRYLTQNLGQAFDLALETKNTGWPRIHPFCLPTRKLGSDNADLVYLQAWIDGKSVYRISGNRGTARFWSITVQGPRGEGALHEPFGDTPEVNITREQLRTEWDGSFVLYIGGERQGPNWLPTTPGTRKLFCRQCFDHWDEQAAAYRIERVDMDGPRPMPDDVEMIQAMSWAGEFVYNAVDYWPDFLWSKGVLCNPQAINRFDSSRIRVQDKAWTEEEEREDALRGRVLVQMHWALQPDEALIAEFENFDAFWMFTNEGIFGNSMDYQYRPVSYTPSRTAVDDDGRIRLILAHRDPGYWNWVDTQEYGEGVLTFRNVLTRHVPDIATTVVKFDELDRHLPVSSRRASAEERLQEMWRRFHAIQRRYRI